MKNVGDMVGKTVLKVTGAVGDGEMEMVFDDGHQVRFYHGQDCCENVSIEEIIGDLQDLIGEPLLRAEESTQDDAKNSESGTWTFYKFATRKGYVDIRWLGESNGYYSESVDMAVSKLEMEQFVEVLHALGK